MLHLIASVGALAGALLIALLVINWRTGTLGVWPPAPKGSCQSIAFWSLFRALNVAALVTATLDWKPMMPDDIIRGTLALLALAGGALYVIACVHLGRVNLYGGKSGLVISGVYAWSRNPQYALAIPTYVALSLAAQSVALAILTGMLVAVFVLMALCEEPWLKTTYGEDYAAYVAQVPRFYNMRRLLSALHSQAPWPPTVR
jgi:protein-S-isoprenylcysteine O-methyltransferase Ste14